MGRKTSARVALLGLIASVLVPAGPSAAATADEPSITFVGGGYGHGIGMSQYGALGRAEAGHTYDQILGFYYDGTVLTDVEAFGDGITDFSEEGDDIDVLLSVRTQVAVSTPLDQVGAWELEVTAGGVPIGTITQPLDAHWDTANGRWIAVSGDDDICYDVSACVGAPLELAMSGDERVVLEQYANGPNIGKYRGGKIILHPAAVNGPKGTAPARCGGPSSFCVIHGDLDLQEYLYGVSEIPFSWHEEALKAQVIAARSYAVSRVLARNASSWPDPFDLYDSVSDQKYSGWDEENYPGGWIDCADGTTWCNAVDATEDLIVDYQGEVAETFYSASNGGATAEPPDVWAGGTTRPYLLAKDDPFDSGDHNPNYSIRERTYTIAQVSEWLNDYTPPSPIPPDQLHVGTVQSILIDAPPSGRVSFAPITIIGSDKTVTVTGRVSGGQIIDDGPYGFRFYAAIKEGCEATPGCDPLISTNFKIASFFDVHPNRYFYGPVTWMAGANITTGVSPTLFAPDGPVTRQQLATFLWRFGDRPSGVLPGPFEDVTIGAYYEEAVAWMAETGITTGTTPTMFSPGHTVTRSEAATFLWRFAGSPDPTVANTFDDVEDGRYYTNAVRWMVEWEITTGTSPVTFAPKDPLTRGQIATFMWRLAGKPDAFNPNSALPSSMRT